MPRLTLPLVILALVLLGCTTAEQETPTQAIAEIIKLYEARDFASLIRTRYAEISKAANEEQVEALIARFATDFNDDAMLNHAVATYQRALQEAPDISKDGNTATFRLEQGIIKLSRMPDGKWGFHL